MIRLTATTALCLSLAVPALADTQIGVTMTSFDSPFLTILLDGIRSEAGKTQGVTLSVEDAFAQPDCPIQIIEKQVANWNCVQAQDLVTFWMTAGLEFDAIVANNDEMAIGAAQGGAEHGIPFEPVTPANMADYQM